jgi:hypothetical protein
VTGGCDGVVHKSGSPVIRPFGLNDIWLVLGLQRSSATLAIEHILTHPRAPLWTALVAPWPWAGAGVATYVLRERSPAPVGVDPQGATGRHQHGEMVGFVQLMKRSARPEADLLHLAPALLAAEGAEVAWDRLLAHCTPAAVSQGLQRIFASIPDGGPEEACLKHAGFSLYTRETIYRLAVAPEAEDLRRKGESTVAPRSAGSHLAAPTGSSGAGTGGSRSRLYVWRRHGRVGRGEERGGGFRSQLPQDSWALQRLYTRCTPRLVQQAEGAITGEVGSPPLSWWEPDSWQGTVWEPAGEVRGAVQVHIGRAGHWLRIWGTNLLAARELRSLVAQGLNAIVVEDPRQRAARFHRARKPLPVYVTVRDYEIGITAILTGFGFAPFTSRARFVKHTGAMAHAPLPVAVTALEARHELRPAR